LSNKICLYRHEDTATSNDSPNPINRKQRRQVYHLLAYARFDDGADLSDIERIEHLKAHFTEDLDFLIKLMMKYLDIVGFSFLPMYVRLLC